MKKRRHFDVLGFSAWYDEIQQFPTDNLNSSIWKELLILEMIRVIVEVEECRPCFVRQIDPEFLWFAVLVEPACFSRLPFTRPRTLKSDYYVLLQTSLVD